MIKKINTFCWFIIFILAEYSTTIVIQLKPTLYPIDKNFASESCFQSFYNECLKSELAGISDSKKLFGFPTCLVRIYSKLWKKSDFIDFCVIFEIQTLLFRFCYLLTKKNTENWDFRKVQISDQFGFQTSLDFRQV